MVMSHFIELITKSYDAFIWLNNESGSSEYWMANADGSDRRQITHFNTSGYGEKGTDLFLYCPILLL